MISHWDDVEYGRRERGHIASSTASLTGDDSVTVGVTRWRVDAGKWSTPAHMEGSEEEIFWVLGGSGLSWQDGETFEVGPGDCLVHLAHEQAHTLLAGAEGLDVLAFGERHYPYGSARLPRAGVSWGLGAWVRTGDPEDQPWKLESEQGPPDVPDPSPRPPRIVNVDDVPGEPLDDAPAGYAAQWRNLGRAAGSQRTGLKHVRVEPGNRNCPAHVHSAEEEIFVVLEGDGTLELVPAPTAAEELREHPVRAGNVIARPAGTRMAHGFKAGDRGLTLLAYGTRDPADVAYYPRTNKLYVRGAGVMFRVEPLPYWEGER